MTYPLTRFCLLLGITVLSGCSAVMGYVGHDNPEISRLSPGLCRETLKDEQYRSFLGQPANMTADTETMVETYKLERDNVGSLDTAIQNLAIMFMTLGIGEAFTSYIEYNKSVEFKLVLEYKKVDPQCKDQKNCPCHKWRLMKIRTVDLE